MSGDFSSGFAWGAVTATLIGQFLWWRYHLNVMQITRETIAVLKDIVKELKEQGLLK